MVTQSPTLTKNSLIQRIIQNSSNPKLIEKAFEYAADAYKEQKRLSGENLIWHALRVASILNEVYPDPATVATGLLHDVLNKKPLSLQRIELREIDKKFGKEIAFLVEKTSRLNEIHYPFLFPKSKPKRGEREETKTENLRKMFFALAEDLRVILVKLASRLDNLETLNYLPAENQKEFAFETLEIFVPVADRLGMWEMKSKLEDLAFFYLYPERLEWLKQNVRAEFEEREKYLEGTKSLLKNALQKEGIKILNIHSRAKSYWSLYQKLLRKRTALGKVYDLIALRVIVSTVEDCYKTLGVIHKYWRPLPERIKDFIAAPKPNRYRSLHTTIFFEEGRITEIQIRTWQMHEEAEYGICAHWAYKEKIGPKALRGRFAWIGRLRERQKTMPEPFKGFELDFLKNRIFVFTPKGEVIELSEGACPVDFAYAVHTEIGNRCSGAKINEKLSPLSQSLKNGDVVEITVDKNKKPSRDWLSFVKTGLASSEIKKFLKEDFSPEVLPKEKAILPLTPKVFLPQRLETPGKIPVFLARETGILMHLGKCCFPSPGDRIGAYITRDRGATVHKINCENFKMAQKKWPQKIIEAAWSKDEKVLYTVTLKIKAEDRVGLFRDVSSIISNLGINILECQAKANTAEGAAIIETKIQIKSFEGLKKICDQVKKIKGVIEVKRV